MNGPEMEFHLRRSPFWTTRFTMLIALSFVGAWWVGQSVAQDLLPGLDPLWATLIVAALGAALGLTLFVMRLVAYRSPPASIRVRPDGLVLPRSVGSGRSFFAPYASIHTVELRGRDERLFLLLGTARRTLILPAYAFERAEDVAVLHAAIIEGIVRQPDGARMLEAMRRGREATQALIEVRPRVTHALLGAIAVAYAIQLLAWPDDPWNTIRLGANARALVWEGQLDRLVTANFLHGPPLHIGLNALGIWMLGGLMERMLGPARYFVIYVLSALGGALASTYGDPFPASVGASTGLVGLFGALAMVHVLHLRHIPPAVRQPARWWLVIIGINAAIGLAIPNVDNWGHGGGLVVGALATVALTWRWPPLAEALRREFAVRILGVALLGLTVVGLGVSAYRAVTVDEPGAVQLARAIAGDPTATATEQNNAAWLVAIDPATDREDLTLALELAERAHERKPDTREFGDTVAQAHWRLGNVDRAIELERRIVTGEPVEAMREVYASQLARFLAGRVAREGPLVIGDGAPELEFEVRNDRLHATMRGEPPPTGLVAYAIVGRRGDLPWLIRMELGPDRTPPATTDLDLDWPDGLRARVALVDTTVNVPRGVEWEVTEYRAVDQVATYP